MEKYFDSPRRLIFWLTVGLLILFTVTPRGYAQDSGSADVTPTTFPYTKKFVITGYYTPLPGQTIYATGTYDGDVRLNGEGEHTADGTAVYPGIAAAPKTFAFGTKMLIPGFGTVAVHDRGGAIKGDRLDIWTGRGEEGLRRAWGWGMRTVQVTVYGVDPNVKEVVDIQSLPLAENIGLIARTQYFHTDLAQGDSGDEVRLMQTFLKKLGYFDAEPTGNFGSDTAEALQKFQLAEKVITTAADQGAGNFGPKTRVALEAGLERAKAKAVAMVPQVQLQKDSHGSEVTNLQQTLAQLNYLPSKTAPTGEYDDATVQAISKLQIDNQIIGGSNESGAGFYGPRTQAVLEQLIKNQYTPKPVISPPTATITPTTRVVAVVFTDDLSLQAKGENVTRLQKELGAFHFLGVEPTGYYGKTTQHAVSKFQEAFGIVEGSDAKGSGVVGPKTRQKLNELLAARATQAQAIASSTEQHELVASRMVDERILVASAAPEESFQAGLSYGARDVQVEHLQRVLKRLGFFPGRLTSQYYGNVTKNAVTGFQKSHGIEQTGLFDERTRAFLNRLVAPPQPIDQQAS